MPVSMTSNCSRGSWPFARVQQPVDDAHLAGLGELDGIAHQIDENLPQAGRIGEDGFGQRAVGLDGERQALSVGPSSHQRGHVGENLPGGGGNALDVELAGLDLGDVEDVVDQGQQHFAVAADGVEVVPAIFLRQLRLQQQVGIAEHGRDGGADFMARVGQELALGLGGGLGGFFRPTQLGVAVLKALHGQQRSRQQEDRHAGQADDHEPVVGDLLLPTVGQCLHRRGAAGIGGEVALNFLVGVLAGGIRHGPTAHGDDHNGNRQQVNVG